MKTMKKLPIGIEHFEEMRREDFYYVDKTGMIKELLENKAKVNLFTRPRRFGKSLNMSMLKYFFEYGCDSSLFEGLAIAKEDKLCQEYMGKFPVVSVTLKGAGSLEFQTARGMLCSIVGNEAMRFAFLENSSRLSDREKEQYRQLVNVDTSGRQSFIMSNEVLEDSLRMLCRLLQKHYDQKVILLIDEYDVPLAKAFENGYYDKMAFLIRNLLEQALKTNSSLKFAVMTGCMRISKESIFTGLNNLKVFSITDERFDEYFGFKDTEVKEMLKYYEIEDHYDEIKSWYDGYQFGDTEVYCPWDVLNHIDRIKYKRDILPENYWINTSSNDAVRKFIQMSGNITTKREIEHLLAGEEIVKDIHQELTYPEMYKSLENIWSLLFMTGYLTQRGRIGINRYKLAIPNLEIRDIFKKQILEYFKEGVTKDGDTLSRFCNALKKGEEKSVEDIFESYLKKTISIRDTFVRKTLKENFYHGILLGILGVKEEWGVFSNQETGDGYSDILIETENSEMAILIELKYANDGNLDQACERALKQIEEKRYDGELRENGINKILKYGIACYMKRCKVKLADE